MKELIIITGISGSGKTTLASTMAKEKDAFLISLDAIKEAFWDKHGFSNEKEKKIL